MPSTLIKAENLEDDEIAEAQEQLFKQDEIKFDPESLIEDIDKAFTSR